MATLEESQLNWEGKCHTLELKLLKFQDQVLKIRDQIKSQMENLEDKYRYAEERATKAEQQVTVLEKRLSAINWSPEEADRKIQDLYSVCRDKDTVIKALEGQLQEEHKLRLHEGKLVEKKATQIKEWVHVKIKEMEVKNQQLRSENDTIKLQVDQLRRRLQALPPSVAKMIHNIGLTQVKGPRLSSHAESNKSPPEIPKRPSSSALLSFNEDLNMDTRSSFTESIDPSMPGSDGNIADTECEPIYTEIHDASREGSTEPQPNGPPRIKIIRKVIHPPTNLSFRSSSTSEDLLEKDEDSPPGSTCRSSTVSTAYEVNDAQTPVELTPKLPPTPLSAFLPAAPPNTPADFLITQTVSALATLPRRNKDKKFFPSSEVGMNPYSTVAKASDYDIKPATRQSRANSVGSATRISSPLRSIPPTPPIRRHVPSWENRIYAVANAGLRMPEGLSCKGYPEGVSGRDTCLDRMYEETELPTYATVKGRATQIHNFSLIGDTSSDSSDSEEFRSARELQNGAVMAAVTAHGLARSAPHIFVRQHSSSGAVKRGASPHSVSSDNSSDSYAMPPDTCTLSDLNDADNAEPEHKLLKTENLKKDQNLQKSGYLTKLGNKVRNWKRRWFILKDGKMIYFKSQNETARKPRGQIILDSKTRILRTEGIHTFEIATCKRTYYLTADSTSDMEQWIKVLQNVLRRQAATQVLRSVDAKALMKGWVVKTKNGARRRCWCSLVGRFLFYYKNQTEKTPVGQINLKEARVEEIDHSCDSDSEAVQLSTHFTIAIWPPHQAPTYLMMPSKKDRDSWLYYLAVASGGGMGDIGTEYEKLISRLIDCDGDQSSPYWRHPELLHTKDLLTTSLTTLPCESMQTKALDLFKSCQLFINKPIESPTIDYHVTLAQNMMSACIEHPELQGELYCQLIKQTSKHSTHRTIVQNLLLCGGHNHLNLFCGTDSLASSTASSDFSDSKFNPTQSALIQAWELLAMCTSLFVPKQGAVLWYLRAHLQRNADPRTEVGKYAAFCQRSLDRTEHNGCREARPSRMEVLSILIRNPYHHSQPISIPAHFANGTYQVVSFDGSTTVDEFIRSLNKAVGLRETSKSGFAMFTDDPTSGDMEYCLQNNIKLCDVISKWEQAYARHHPDETLPETNRTVRLTYKMRMYFKSAPRMEKEKEKLLICYQISDEIVHGRFPITKECALDMAALMAQIEFGDYKASDSTGSNPALTLHNSLPSIVHRFYPNRYMEMSEDEIRNIISRLSEKWLQLKGKTTPDCVRAFLNATRRWPFFGAKLFYAMVTSGDSPQPVWIAVQEDAVCILDYATMNLIVSYKFCSLVSFGGNKDNFMLSVTRLLDSGRQRTDKLLFNMGKAKIMEITELIASYINAQKSPLL